MTVDTIPGSCFVVVLLVTFLSAMNVPGSAADSDSKSHNLDGHSVKRQVALTPTCTQPLYTGIVNENSPPGIAVVQATATSPVGNQLVWSIQDTTFQRFSINPATGAVSVAGSLTRAAMQRSAIEFRIRATDSNNQLYCESTVRVNVLPNGSGTPGGTGTISFSQPTYSFSTSSCQPGLPVGQIAANNPFGGTTYSLTGTSLFTINPQSGQILSNNALSPGVYTLSVVATSSSGQSATASVTLTVQCSSTGGGGGTAPSFSQPSYTVSSSSCTQGSSIVQVQAGGSATTPTTYYVAGTSQFAINPQSGLLTLAQNVAAGSYTFQVIAQSAFGQAIATVTINMSCSGGGTPGGSSQYYFTSGSCPAGTQLGSICANSYG